MLSILKTFIGEDLGGAEIFRVRRRFAFGSTKMEATFFNPSTNSEVLLELRGNMWGGRAEITMMGQVIAQISRQLFNVAEIFFDHQTYFVTVAPGVDLSLIAAICICFDEVKHEGDRRDF